MTNSDRIFSTKWVFFVSLFLFIISRVSFKQKEKVHTCHSFEVLAKVLNGEPVSKSIVLCSALHSKVCSTVHMQCSPQCNAMQHGAIFTVQCSAVQCSAVQCSAVQCSAVQCSAVQCSAVQCSAVQCSAVQCSAVQCSAVQCSAVQCSAVQCSAVQCSAVQCGAVRCSAVQCSAVQYNVMWYSKV